MEEQTESRRRRVLFIKRERLRRTLMKVTNDDIFCVAQEDAENLLSWIKELETRISEMNDEIVLLRRKVRP